MKYPSLDAFLTDGKAALAKGPVAIVFAEDQVEVDSTLRHNLNAGFAQVILLAPEGIAVPAALEPKIHWITYDVRSDSALIRAVNKVIAAAPGIWLYYGYNAEYLFHPFCETRNLQEMLAFHAEERRDAVFTCVIDLYPGGPVAAIEGLDRANAHIDGAGYYSLPRLGADGQPIERQVEVHGGLRWRFDDHVDPGRRRIDRIALFRAQAGLQLLLDHRFSIAEYNTFACPWHHNLTACVLSLRAAKALRGNPGSRHDTTRFDWSRSVRFDWSSRQLMDLGLMEPGQWF